MKYLNIVFPEDVSCGAITSIFFDTEISSIQDGRELRFSEQNLPKKKYKIPGGIYDTEYGLKMSTLFSIAKGETNAMMYKDWSNYKASNDNLFSIEGEQKNKLKLYKKFEYQNYYFYYPVVSPVINTFKLYNDSVLVDNSMYRYDFESSSLIINFTPQNYQLLTFSTDFYTIVRFDMKNLDIEHISHNQIKIPDIILAETITY